jgi:hypothetical protein
LGIHLFIVVEENEDVEACGNDLLVKLYKVPLFAELALLAHV